MTTNEFHHHLTEVFPQEYFGARDNFIMSKSALLEGLQHLGVISMMIEEDMQQWSAEAPSDEELKDCAKTCAYLMRQMNAVTSILIIGLDGVHFKS